MFVNMRDTTLMMLGLVLLFHANASSNPPWDAQFVDVITRFGSQESTSHPYSSYRFKKVSRELLKGIKRRQNDWINFVQEGIDINQMFFFRQTFLSFPYVHRVHQTKQGTLVYTTLNHPEVFIKIDNRHEEFDHGLRSYFQAYENARSILKRRDYRFLYFPHEYGDTVYLDLARENNFPTGVVFSEKIPQFSTADVDNIVLLHHFINRAMNSDSFRAQLQAMYLEMIDYICRADFDDINYRNVVFTKTGNLSPFDTDFGSARTGVYSFLKEFYASLFIDLSEVDTKIESSCSNLALIGLGDQRDQLGEVARFTKNDVHLQRMVQFLESHPIEQRGSVKLAHLVEEEFMSVAIEVDGYLSEQPVIDETRPIFGQRCEHVRDIVTNISNRAQPFLKNVPSEVIDGMVRTMLALAQEQGLLFATKATALSSLNVRRDLLSYVCF